MDETRWPRSSAAPSVDAFVFGVPPLALTALAHAVEDVGRVTGWSVFLNVDKTRDIERPHQAGDPRPAFAALDRRPTHDFEQGAREAHADCVDRGWP